MATQVTATIKQNFKFTNVTMNMLKAVQNFRHLIYIAKVRTFYAKFVWIHNRNSYR